MSAHDSKRPPGRAAGPVPGAQGAGRLAALARWGADRSSGLLGNLRRGDVLSQAVAARERGNAGAAYWLGREAAEQEPAGESEASTFFWQMAGEYGRPEEALGAAARLIEAHAVQEPAFAGEVWMQVCELGLELTLHPGILARVLDPLAAEASRGPDEPARARAGASLVAALRRIADAEGLEAPVALRAVTFARDHDLATARRLARRALESPHLHEGKRARLEALLSGQEPAPGGPPAVPAPAAAADASILTDLELVGEDVSVDAVGEVEPDSSGRRSEDDTEPMHPARNHPLFHEDAAHKPLSDDEVQRLQCRLERVAGSRSR